MSQTFCLLGLLHSKQTNDFLPWSNFKTNFEFGLVSLDYQLRMLVEYFCESFSQTEMAFAFFFLLLVPVQCLNNPFCTLPFSQAGHIKYTYKFSKLSAILKHKGKNFVMMMSVTRLSSNRSQVTTNQNAGINISFVV